MAPAGESLGGIMRRAARTDENQAEIVEALRKAGAKVTLLHQVGGGCPDLLVGKRDRSFALVEVKDGEKPPSARKLTPDEQAWHDAHEGFPVYVITSVNEALSVLVVD